MDHSILIVKEEKERKNNKEEEEVIVLCIRWLIICLNGMEERKVVKKEKNGREKNR